MPDQGAHALDRLFFPKNIAVVGVSPTVRGFGTRPGTKLHPGVHQPEFFRQDIPSASCCTGYIGF